MFLQCFKGDRGKLLRSNNNAPAPPSQNLFPILATLFNSRALDRRRFRGVEEGVWLEEGTFQTESTKLSIQNMLPGNQNDMFKFVDSL